MRGWSVTNGSPIEHSVPVFSYFHSPPPIAGEVAAKPAEVALRPRSDEAAPLHHLSRGPPTPLRGRGEKPGAAYQPGSGAPAGRRRRIDRRPGTLHNAIEDRSFSLSNHHERRRRLPEGLLPISCQSAARMLPISSHLLPFCGHFVAKKRPKCCQSAARMLPESCHFRNGHSHSAH